MPKILIVGGGYAGFYTAWKLEKQLRRGEAEVTMVDPRPYMTYQPFLPEIAAGSIDPRHSVVAHRAHLKKTRIITAAVTSVNHAEKKATITPTDGAPFEVDYDIIVMTAGSVSRTFPIPGVADEAIGMKNIEEAVAVRDRILTNFDKAALLPAGPERDRLLTFVVIGGGFAGIETIAELRSFASALVKRYPEISFEDTHFHLIEAMGRIMPEVSLKTSHWVLKNLAQRGAQVHLDTQLTSAVGGKIELSTGQSFESDLIIWTAGVMAHPVLRNTDLPIEERGRLRVQSDLRVINDDGVVADAWGAGDVSAVPDDTGFGVGGFCVPNAQHAVRQGKLLSKNIIATLRGELPAKYWHKPAGAVAGLGLGVGVFQKGKLGITGFPAWVMHRGYHGLAMPTWERKIRVVGGWVLNLFLGRDIASLKQVEDPRAAFEEYASRPKAPAAQAPVEAAPVASTPAKPTAKTADKSLAKAATKPSAKAPVKRAAKAPIAGEAEVANAEIANAEIANAAVANAAAANAAVSSDDAPVADAPGADALAAPTAAPSRPRPSRARKS